MQSKGRTAVLAVFLAVVICGMFVLSGCTGFFGARVDTEGTDPYETPNVRGVWNAGSINDEIQPYFDDVIAALKQANSNEANELVGKMRYSVETVDGQAVLRSWIEGTAEQKIKLPDILLDAKSCVVADHVPECLSDYETLKYAMTVAAYGVDVDIYNMDSTVSAAQMASVLISWYESKTGVAVDYSAVSAAVSDEASKKLLALIPDYEYASELLADSDVTTTIFVDTLAALMSELDFEMYGVGSGNVKLLDFVRYAELYLNMYTPEGINYNYTDSSSDNGESDETDSEADSAEEDVKLSTDWAALVAEINLYNTIDSVMAQSEESITRLDLADNMLSVLKAGYDNDVQSQITLSDCSDESAKIMVDYAIMTNFPESSNLFSPDYKIRANELPSLVADFTKHCFTSWNNEGSYHYYDQLTMNVICTSFASLESFYVNQNYYPPEEPAETVDNGIAADWFMTSANSGEYTEKNVTVAAAAMALHWTGHTEYSVETLRSAYISDTDAEWKNELIVSVLEEYGETAAVFEDITTDTLLAELRAGNIVIARYSDTGTNEVQCMVIYGFEKNGNSIKYLVNDPHVKHTQTTYANGNVPGKGEIIEGELALWLINEAGGDYAVVYADGNAPATNTSADA